MEIKDIMTQSVVSIDPNESVEVAARTMTQHNIGALPVCANGKLCGMLTDRDIVTRCLAANRQPANTQVRQVMTEQVTSVRPDMETGAAAHLMGRLQIRRLPVVENGKLCGMVSLGDMATREETVLDAGDVLADVSSNLSQR
ncbi:MAG: CBS domain-containing protein [Oscillospiraceae bacterium]|nr:CBS domain-containing protein [Oscillospiraceae bacterium]